MDRLITAQVPGSSAAAYTYDPTGQRVRQTVGSDTTNYLWDELSAYGDVVLESDGSGTPLTSYVLANTRLLSQRQNNSTHYYLSDGQGSVRDLTDTTGIVTDTYAYTAFGELYNSTGTTDNAYLYTGQQFDGLTELYSLRARYYDSDKGNFLSRDEFPYMLRNPFEFNRYTYTANNPINYFDPSGAFAADYSANNAESASIMQSLNMGLRNIAQRAVQGWRNPFSRGAVEGALGYLFGLYLHNEYYGNDPFTYWTPIGMLIAAVSGAIIEYLNERVLTYQAGWLRNVEGPIALFDRISLGYAISAYSFMLTSVVLYGAHLLEMEFDGANREAELQSILGIIEVRILVVREAAAANALAIHIPSRAFGVFITLFVNTIASLEGLEDQEKDKTE